MYVFGPNATHSPNLSHIPLHMSDDAQDPADVAATTRKRGRVSDQAVEEDGPAPAPVPDESADDEEDDIGPMPMGEGDGDGAVRKKRKSTWCTEKMLCSITTDARA